MGETKASNNVFEMNRDRNDPEHRFSSCGSEKFLEIKTFYENHNLVAFAPCNDSLGM